MLSLGNAERLSVVSTRPGFLLATGIRQCFYISVGGDFAGLVSVTFAAILAGRYLLSHDTDR